ncbi:MAG: hypothetical protein WC742_03490 [Gallionellaceae bacterium]|jgi:hypothetical protein
MRVFYPITTRLSEFVNDEKQDSSAAIMMLWSLLSIALLVLVLLALHSFKASAIEKQPESYSNLPINTAVRKLSADAIPNSQTCALSKTALAGNAQGTLSVQDYISAHRAVQLLEDDSAVKTLRHSDAPAKWKASAGQFL